MTPEALIPGFAWLAPRLLLLFGLGFLVANLRLGIALIAYRRRRASALLTWEAPRPAHFGFSLALGVVLGALLVVEVIVLRRAAPTVFGEAMMFLYYGYLFPLSTRIRRGFYADGVWSDGPFLGWGAIAAVSWREEGQVTLVLILRAGNLARRLAVPGHLYGQARRLLQDRVDAHDIHFGGAGLDLGSRAERDTV